MAIWIKRITLAGTACLFFLVLVEFILAAAGFPRQHWYRFSHPKNFSEHRDHMEFSYRFETNSQGLRYRELSKDELDRGTRIFVLGDSFTKGRAVDATDRFTHHLETAFSSSQQPWYFINAGMSGAGPLQYLRCYHHIAPQYHPQAVLIFSMQTIFLTVRRI